MNFKRYNKRSKAVKKAAKPSEQAPSPQPAKPLDGPTTFVLTRKLIRKLKSLFKTKIFRLSKASVTVAHGGLATLEESIRETLDDAADIIEEIRSVIELSSTRFKRGNSFDCNQAILQSPTTMAHSSPETGLGLIDSPRTLPTQPSSPTIKRAEFIPDCLVVAQKNMVVQDTVMPFDTRDILKDLDLVYPNLEGDREIPSEDDTTLGMVIINSQSTEDNFLQEFEISEDEEVLAELMQIRDELVFGRPESTDATKQKSAEGTDTTNQSDPSKPTTPAAKDIVAATDRIVRIVHRCDYETTNAVYDQLIKAHEIDSDKSAKAAPSPSIDPPKNEAPGCALLPLFQQVNLKHKRRQKRTIATHTYIKSREVAVLDSDTNSLRPFHLPPQDKKPLSFFLQPSRGGDDKNRALASNHPMSGYGKSPFGQEPKRPADGEFVQNLKHGGRLNLRSAPRAIKTRYYGMYAVLFSIPVIFISSLEMYRRLEGTSSKKVQEGEILEDRLVRKFDEAEKWLVERQSLMYRLFGKDFFLDGFTSKTMKSDKDK